MSPQKRAAFLLLRLLVFLITRFLILVIIVVTITIFGVLSTLGGCKVSQLVSQSYRSAQTCRTCRDGLPGAPWAGRLCPSHRDTSL